MTRTHKLNNETGRASRGILEAHEMGHAPKVLRTAAPMLPFASVCLSLADWDALPLSARVTERLAEILVLATEARAELEKTEAAPLVWIVPTLDRVVEHINALLSRLAS